MPNKASIYLKPVGFLTDAVRRGVKRVILEQDRRAATERRAVERQFKAARSEYRRQLTELMGRSNMRGYRELRADLARAPRRKRIREARKQLAAMGVNVARAERLRQQYLIAVRQLLEAPDLSIARRHRLPLDECSPWVTYAAPYAGYFWSYAWSRSDEADDPVLNRYLDAGSGHIGSSIRTRLSGADDDDFVTADYYTSLNVWHTVPATGVLEGYLAFEFNASPYSGQVQDEFGFSSAVFTQWARARLRAVDTSGALDTQDSRIFNYIDTVWGDDVSWDNYVSAPRDLHWYFFRTTVPFEKGRVVLLEAGIWNVTWFEADDESITTADNLDLRLDRIMVRSCPGPIIL